MGSSTWSFKSRSRDYSYSYPTYSPTYNYPRTSKYRNPDYHHALTCPKSLFSVLRRFLSLVGAAVDGLHPEIEALNAVPQDAPNSGYALHRLFVQLHGWQMKGTGLRDTLKNSGFLGKTHNTRYKTLNPKARNPKP